MRIGPIAGLTLCVISLGCAGTPTRPTPASHVPTTQASVGSTGVSAGPARSYGGGGTIGEPACLVDRPCRLIGEVRFTSAASEATGSYSPFFQQPAPERSFGAQALTGNPGTDIYDFALLARSYGTGRFAGGPTPATISLQVTAQVANVTVTFSRSGGRIFEASASTQPVFTSTADPNCLLSGVRLQTKLLVELEHFGKSEIIDSHCTLVP